MVKQLGTPHRAAVEPSDAASAVRVLVLGPLTIEYRGRTLAVAGTQRRRLLALLASRAGRVVPVDAIVDALWADDPPPTAAKTVQSHVVRLRNSFVSVGRDLIETAPGGYRLAVQPDSIDSVAFERLARDGNRSLKLGDLAGAVTTLEEALATWRGAPYGEFDGAAFAVAEAGRLDELRLQATEDLAEARLEFGDLGAVTADLEQLVNVEPGRERSWGLLMRALYAGGRQNDALNAFQRARRVLADEFGLSPGPELRQLERRVLDQDPRLAAPEPRSVPAGLRREPNSFVGRTRELSWLLKAWTSAQVGSGQFRAIFGPIDSGRTRLAAELAASVVGDGGQVVHARGAEGFSRAFGLETAPPGSVVDLVADRCRRSPLLVVVDDAEWSTEETSTTIVALSSMVEHLPVLIVPIADPDVGGPAIGALRRIDPSGDRTIVVSPMADNDIARIVEADGVDESATGVVVAVADGRPGVARREAAAWCERAAADRLHDAAAASIDALSVADASGSTVLHEVLQLVAARSRRHDLASSTWTGRQPYRALSSYQADDVDIFVGRERAVAELAARVLDRRLVVVVGPSGSGKSSVVRAGLVPLVQSGRLPGQKPWRATVTTPGNDPIAALDQIPDVDDAGPQLIVLDQFEEAFAAGATVVERLAGRLLDLILDPALDAHVVLVVRADQFGSIAESPRLAELAGAGQVLVGAPTDEEVRRIIEEPARRAGCTVEARLIRLIESEVGGHESILPLLSVTLADLWQHREQDVLLASRYVEIGGLAASIERLGNRALELAGVDHRDNVRRVMLLLADVTDDGAWVRRRVALGDVSSELERALDALVEARVVTRDADSATVVHEVVFRAWPELVTWLDEAKADIVLEREVRTSARAWDAGSRTDDDVLRGARLVAAEAWVARRGDVPQAIADFVTAGRIAADREHAQLTDQLATERRNRRRLGRAFVAASLLLVVAVIATLLARDRQRDAQSAEATAATARDEARVERDEAGVARLVAESERAIDSRLDLSLLLAVEARRHADTVATRGALLTSLTSDVSAQPALDPEFAVATIPRKPSSFRGFVATGMTFLFDVDVSDDGQTAAVIGDAGRGSRVLAVYDTSSRSELRRIPDNAFDAQVDLSPNGRTVLMVTSAGGVELIDARTDRRTTLSITDASYGAFSPDGRMFLIVRHDLSIRLHMTASGDELDVAVPDADGRELAFFAPDGTLVIGVDNTAFLFWDPAFRTDPRIVHLDILANHSPSSYTMSPDGAVIVANVNEQLIVYNADTGARIGLARDRPGSLRGNAEPFVADRIVALGRFNGEVIFYDLIAERVLGDPLSVHGGGIRDLAASVDGETLVTVADDGNLAVWGTNEHGLIDRAITTDGVLPDFAANGTRFFAAAGPGQIATRSIDASAPDVVRHPATDEPIGIWGELSDDGAYLIESRFRGDTSQVWIVDVLTGDVLWVSEPESPAQFAALSPDHRTVYALEKNFTTIVAYDVASGESKASAAAGDVRFSWVEFTSLVVSPDGRFLDANLEGRAIARFDAETLASVRIVELGGNIQGNLAHIPVTQDIVGSGGGGRVYRVDMTTGDVVIGQSRDTSSLASVNVSPDGALIVAHHVFTGREALFDAATLEQVGLPLPARPGGYTPAFTAEGDLLTSGVFGASLWNLDPDVWQEQACLAAGRNLTRTEWTEYLPDEPYRSTCDQWPAAS